MIGAGLEIYKWAAERGLEVPLSIFLFIVLIILIVIAANMKNEPCFTSLCRNCKYEKRRQGDDSLFCSLYKPKLLFMRKRLSQCPFEKLINEAKQKKGNT